MNTTMIGTQLKTEFPKDTKPAVKPGGEAEPSDFLQQIRSMQEKISADKKTAERAQAKEADKAKHKPAEKPAAKETAPKDSELHTEDEADKSKEQSQGEDNAGLPLLNMLPLAENPATVVDVSKLFIPADTKNTAEQVLGLGELPEMPTETPKNVSQNSQDNANTAFEVALETAVDTFIQPSEAAVLAGQAAAQSKDFGNTQELHPSNAQSIQTGLENHTPQVQAVQPMSSQEQQTASGLQADTAETAQTLQQAGNTNEAKAKETKQSADMKTEFRAPVAEEAPKLFTAQKKTAEQASTQAQTAVPKEQGESEENLFVTDRLKQNTDKLEQLLANAQNDASKTYRTEAAKVKEVDFIPGAPLAEQVSKEIVTSIKDGTKELIMQLQPKELGRLMIKMSMENNRLTINITADTLHGQKAITDQLGILENAMKSQNVTVDRINVTYDAFNNMNSSHNPNNQGNPNFMFDGRDKDGRQGSQAQYGYSGDTAEEVEPQIVPPMIIGDDRLNYIV